MFLLFELEIFLVFPYAVSSFNNEIYGLAVLLIFFFVVTLGFIFELGKGALNIYTKQNTDFTQKKASFTNISLLN